jgi:hypothetical protein
MGNRVWKDGARRGVAYVEGREMAEWVMALTGRRRVAVQDRDTASATARRGAAARKAATVVPGGPSPEQAKRDAAMEGAMAVYSDRKGRPFAWQIPFDLGQWDVVTAAIEPEVLPALPAAAPPPAAIASKATKKAATNTKPTTATAARKK